MQNKSNKECGPDSQTGWERRHTARVVASLVALTCAVTPAVAMAEPASDAQAAQAQSAEATGTAELAVASDAVETKVSLTTRQFRFADDAGYEADELTWTSDNAAVATVNEEGLVTAVAPGTATVTATHDGTVVSTTTVSVAKPDYASAYDTMQDRWLRRIVGTTPSEGAIDTSDSALVAYAQAQIADAASNWKALDELRDANGKATCWPKIESDSPSANYTSQLKKLRPLVIAFGMNLEGNDLYQSRELYDDIMSVLSYFVSPDGMNYGTEDWRDYRTDTVVSNWWDWQIGCPGRLADMLIVMSDYCDFSQIEPVVDAVGTYCQEPEKQLNAASGWVTSTGSNRTDIANAMMGMAIVSHTSEGLTLVDEQVPNVLAEVTTGDGIYADGSVVQHTAQAYTGSYGNELIKGVAKITAILADTDWAFNDPGIYNLYNAVVEGYIPLMHGSEMMSMVCGRAAARVQDSAPYSAERYWGNETIANLLNIAQSAPEPYKGEMLGALKGWLLDAGDDYFDHARDFDAMLLAKALVEDDSVVPVTYTGMSVFGSMDRVVQQTESYAAGLSMFSSRIYNYECMNNENKHGWHQGDGMLYVYDGGAGADDIGFWPTVDPYRLPGTTVDTRELEDGVATATLSSKDWVGGVTDGTNGAAGMDYDASCLDQGMDLTAKKSYFFLDGRIVELGAGITGTTDASIETTVDNRIIDGTSTGVSVNGTSWNGRSEAQLSEGDYVTLAADGSSDGMGYYFLEDTDASIAKETRSGSYAEINDSFPYAEKFTRSYFKLGIDHGQKAENDTYAFMLVPGATNDSMAAYAADPTVEVISNTSDVQAVSDSSTGTVAGNVWAEDGATFGGITVDSAASVYTTSSAGVMTVCVSDPTQKGDSVTVRIDGSMGLLSSDGDVTVNEDGSYTVKTAGSAGATHTFKIAVSQSTCDGGEQCPSKDLSDVEVGSWYHDAVDWAVETGLMGGYGDGSHTFGPANPLTRAELAKILYNQAGSPDVDASLVAKYPDCSADEWYAKAVAWATSEGYFGGYENGTFGPSDKITREQAATVLWRVAESPEAEADLSGFPDGGGVSDFASTAMRWAVSEGILRGQDATGALDPVGTFSRAQAAAVFMRIDEAR